MDFFHLTPDQRRAALERDRDMVVTAGAGSGKTRTLVARYASLLADGLAPRDIAAITFTEKAAREMRARVRMALSDLVKEAASEEERQRWIGFNAGMDAARIGTIHSLCAEILRAHPAEAMIDPKFDVMDEGQVAALQAQMVQDTLALLVDRSEYAPLFMILTTTGLEQTLTFLLSHRLEAQEMCQHPQDCSGILQAWLEGTLKANEIRSSIDELRLLKKTSQLLEVTDKLREQIEDMLALWGRAEDALQRGDPIAAAQYLFQARRNKMSKSAGSRESAAWRANAALQEAYDKLLHPVIGGKDSTDRMPDSKKEAQFIEAAGLLARAFGMLSDGYRKALQERSALDFDDLEDGATRLLQRPEIRTRWQKEIHALLVDEFQDTNDRQRQIVDALCGEPGNLFIVGDARQSIYRFRRADVTVFRAVQEDIHRRGGLVINLDQTYRAHEPLLNAAGDMLQAIMGSHEDPSRPYYVPYAPLRAVRKHPPEHMATPHVELVLGLGEDAASARPQGARALAQRLVELKEAGQITSWDDVTLLFRASTGFPAYEDAFEDAGVPFVTVAGRGFYNRPEIRDVLNILRALADPADDLAMAGLLRSPAFGLTDAALYQLRWQTGSPQPYWQALQGDLSCLMEIDRHWAVRAIGILNSLFPKVDRVPVSELLKQVVDATDYRVILSMDGSGAGGRLWRNLDKLLADAYSSGQVNVRDFLDYLVTLDDAGAREGEAPAEAQGAVRLMTIHKAKGLEFPVVVLADASRETPGNRDAVYLSPQYGVSFKLDPVTMLYRLAKWEDNLQSEAEACRPLYVALTRARDKLIISGHCTSNRKSGWKTKGWSADLCATAQVDLDDLAASAGAEVITTTSSGQPVRAWALPESALMMRPLPVQAPAYKESEAAPLHAPLYAPQIPLEEETLEERRDWRATSQTADVPPGVVGQMVHKAIELWLFPGNVRLTPMLETAALNAGLVQPEQRQAAVRTASRLLERLQKHPLFTEIETAAERYHEAPYSRMVSGRTETGYIDILLQTSDGWQIIDFKTDAIHSTAQREDLVNHYLRQLERYAGAVHSLTGQNVSARICFLDDRGKVSVQTVIP
jgi:ATP-dependent helicase/nuclease subunit A